MKGIMKWLPFERTTEKPGPSSLPMATSPLHAMRVEMDRVFDRFLNEPFGGPWTGIPAAAWLGDFTTARFLPSVDICDGEKSLRVVAELPGLEEKDIDVSVQDGLLVIRGEKKLEESEQQGDFYRVERAHGRFERAIPLPTEVDMNAAEARLEKGVLTVTLPKLLGEASARKKIPVRADA